MSRQPIVRSVLPLVLPELVLVAALVPSDVEAIDVGRFVRFVGAGIVLLTVAILVALIVGRVRRG
jgi:hypothetical protein